MLTIIAAEGERFKQFGNVILSQDPKKTNDKINVVFGSHLRFSLSLLAK